MKTKKTASGLLSRKDYQTKPSRRQQAKRSADLMSEVRRKVLKLYERAFTEWDRRYREEPERFMSEACHLLKGTPKTYGEACAPYFFQIMSGLSE